jgi:uncharacterized protein YndB with AHSA1/START domain
MKKLEYKITIAAPVKKVWDTMLNPETYKIWSGAGWPDSFYKGKWEEGQKINFIGDDGSGTLVIIKKLIQHEYILAEHIAILEKGGVEDVSGSLAKNWIGNTESYTFKETNGETKLTVEINTHPDWEKMFTDGWPNALAKLKEICEK